MAPKYFKIQPSLPVASIPDAITYYTECLGFRVAGRDGDNHCWVQLVDEGPEKDSVSMWDVAVNIYLRKRGFAGPKVLPMVDDVKFGKVYIHIDGEDDELEKLAETLQARGVKVVGEVETKPWGMKELLTEDPDGNKLVFDQMVKRH